jgi:hypothetical protein
MQVRPLLFPRFADAWVLVGLAVCLAVIFVQADKKIIDGRRPESSSAFQRWLPTVRRIPDANIWKETNWPNGPIMAMILKPFADLETPHLGARLWLLFKMLCAVASVFLVFRMLDRPEHPFPLWGKALVVLLTVRPIEGDLVHGNVNLFILLTVVFGAFALHRRWDLTAGVSLALGMACKLTPALFVPYLVWKRAWKALGGVAVGLVLWLLVVPSLYYGWERNVHNLEGWYAGMIRPFVEKYEVTSELPNQSLPGLLERMLRHRPSATRWADDHYEPTAYHNVADLSPQTVGLIAKGCLLLFTLAVALRCRAPHIDRTDWRWLAEFGVVVLGMLLFSERTWKHHAVTLLIPFGVLCHQISAFRLPVGRWRYCVRTLTAVALLMLLTASGSGEGKDTFSDLALTFGAYTWSFAILLVAMFTLTGQKKNASSRGVDATDEKDLQSKAA